MFYSLMFRRGFKLYKKNYISLLCVFALSFAMLTFLNVYCDSQYNYDEAVLMEYFIENRRGSDFRVSGVTESEAEEYKSIENVTFEYIDGSLYMTMQDKNDYTVVLSKIKEVFDSQLSTPDGIHDHEKGLSIYYNNPPKINTGNEARVTTLVFQIILSASAISAISFVYGAYIKDRASDILTLTSIGIGERRLCGLFFREFNLLYLLSAIIGVPAGSLLVFIICKLFDFVDMSMSNSVYPVFKLNAVTIIAVLVFGYIALYISYRIAMLKVLAIDVSAARIKNEINFNPDRARAYYYKASEKFEIFMSKLFMKRRPAYNRFLKFQTVFNVAVSIFILFIVNYIFITSNSNGARDASAIAAMLATMYFFIVSLIFALIYGVIVINLIIKRHMEAHTESSKNLLTLGASDSMLCGCFVREAVTNAAASIVVGLTSGYILTLGLFASLNYSIYPSVFLFIGSAVIIAAFASLHILTVKHSFRRLIRSGELDLIGGLNGTSGNS